MRVTHLTSHIVLAAKCWEGIIMRTLRLNNIRSAINRWGPPATSQALPCILGGENELICQNWERQPELNTRGRIDNKIHQKQNKDVVGPVVAHCHHLLSLILLRLLISDAGWAWRLCCGVVCGIENIYKVITERGDQANLIIPTPSGGETFKIDNQLSSSLQWFHWHRTSFCEKMKQKCQLCEDKRFSNDLIFLGSCNFCL